MSGRGWHQPGKSSMGDLETELRAFAAFLRPNDGEIARANDVVSLLEPLLAACWGASSVQLAGALGRGTWPSPVEHLEVRVILEGAPNPSDFPSAEDLTLRLQGAPLDAASPAAEGVSLQLDGRSILATPVLPARPPASPLSWRDGQWRPGPPGEPGTWRAAADGLLEGRSGDLLRLLNHWSRLHGLALRPLHLEVVALQAIRKPTPRLARALLTVLQALPGALHEPCQDPAHPEERLDLYQEQAQAGVDAGDAAFHAARKLAQALDAESTGEPWGEGLLREILGPDFA